MATAANSFLFTDKGKEKPLPPGGEGVGSWVKDWALPSSQPAH